MAFVFRKLFLKNDLWNYVAMRWRRGWCRNGRFLRGVRDGESDFGESLPNWRLEPNDCKLMCVRLTCAERRL